MTDVVRTRTELAHTRSALDGRVALVPTMGALHEGHAALIDAARGAGDHVVVSLFVNPTQFAAGEDLSTYPRTLDADLALCAEHGADLVWAPGVEDIYPHGDPEVTVHPGPLADELEGASRPTHFAGVLTVVAKLFGLTRAHVACFGEKDYQQLVLVRAMSRDLELGVDVVGVPTVREAGGLALSSRNRYLSSTERRQAMALSRALFAGRDAADAVVERAGAGTAGAIADTAGAVALAAAGDVLDSAPGVEPDYLALRADDLGQAGPGPARLLVAARVGPARLIDNVGLFLGERDAAGD